MGFFSLMLPHTPPGAKGKAFSIRRALGLDALVMLKDKSFLIFSIASVLACIPLTFYYSFTNDYLNDVHVANAAGKMTLGQVSEVGMMLVMPWVLRRVSVKGILLIGLGAWVTRYALLALGDAGPGVWMLYIAILLHGVCYDFFFMTGQLYTDQEAPAHLRSAAQGFITFMTYGVGMYAGSLISGNALDFFTNGAGVHDWKTFWLSSAAGAAVILLIVATMFRSHLKIEAAEQS
jgi:nucleoside transporter